MCVLVNPSAPNKRIVKLRPLARQIFLPRYVLEKAQKCVSVAFLRQADESGAKDMPDWKQLNLLDLSKECCPKNETERCSVQSQDWDSKRMGDEEDLDGMREEETGASTRTNVIRVGARCNEAVEDGTN
jgi:hypothetical protein